MIAACVAVAIAGCQIPFGQRAPSPAPKVTVEGLGVACPGGDHGIDRSVQFGWSFCYPATWKFQERLQPVPDLSNPAYHGPRGTDDTFDVVNDLPTGQPGSGDFGFIIVGSYGIDGATSLGDWATAHLGADEKLTPITWANAKAAAQDGAGRRFALTATRVVELDVRGDPIVQAMVSRLASWRFGP